VKPTILLCEITNREVAIAPRRKQYFYKLLKKILRFYILFIYFTHKNFVCCFYTIKALLNFISSLVYTIQKNPKIYIPPPLLFSADSFYKINYMKINYFSLFVLLCSITLFGLIIYRLADPNLTDEKKKQLSYGEIVLSFFSGLMFLFSMFYIIILVSYYIASFNKNYFFSSLKTTILAIFYIITSPFSLSIIHYCFQEKLGNNEKILSILQLFSTLFCVLFVFFPEIFIKKPNLFWKIISPYP